MWNNYTKVKIDKDHENKRYRVCGDWFLTISLINKYKKLAWNNYKIRHHTVWEDTKHKMLWDSNETINSRGKLKFSESKQEKDN